MNQETLQDVSKAQMGTWFDLANLSVGEYENWMNLNLSVYKEIMGEFADCCNAACDVRDVGAALQWQSMVFRPFLERAVQYNTRLVGVANGSARELSRLVEKRWHQANEHLHHAGPWSAAAWPWPRSSDVSTAALQEATQALFSLWSAMAAPGKPSPRRHAAGNDVHALHNGPDQARPKPRAH